MDYGHELKFGLFPTPDATGAQRVVDLALLAEDVGLDLVSVQDHPYSPMLDAWTLLSVIAARTQRVHVSPNVANLPLRPPVVLARSAATLDVLSGGRVELGLGAGAFHEAIKAAGGPDLTAKQSVDALIEGIEVIRGIWGPVGGHAVQHPGTHYDVRGIRPGPAPAHQIGIWIGSYKPRMLRITGELADGWLPSSSYAAPEVLDDMNRAIDEAAIAAGRSPSDVTRLYNIMGRFGGYDGFPTGSAREWIEQLAELTLDSGMSTYILASDDPDTIRRFAGEVAPGVRELVAAERSSSPDDPLPLGSPAEGLPAAPRAKATIEASPLTVVPTPDPVTRRSSEQPWDESTRPHGPAPDPTRLYTPHEQASGQHLIDVHDQLRQELEQLRGIVDQVIAGQLDVAEARSAINESTMRQNNWTAGVYCAQYCRVVTTHHTIEDVSVFPHLRSAQPSLDPVIDRLEEEHRVIHSVLDGVDQALVAFVSEPDGPARLQDALDLLSDTLLSHLSYEEQELVEPLARLGFS